jgi:putative ABC transport system permease protein
MRRVIAALLFLYPSSFRRAFGDDMLADFEDRWRERPGWRLALRTVFDVITAAVLERLSVQPDSIQPRKGDSSMTTLWQDLRFAWRMLLRSPGFTAAALVTLALGIGVNTAMFSIANSVLWRSLPYPHPERVVMAGEVDAKKPDVVWGVSYPSFRDWRARAASFEHLAGILNDERVLRAGDTPVRVSGLAVTHDFFNVMGVQPAQGRVFSESEDQKGAAPVIVLSHRMWAGRFGSDAAILGRQVRFDSSAFTVVGVMPAGFEYKQAEYWMPLEPVLDDYFRAGRSVWVLTAAGRLRDGKTALDSQVEVEAIAAQIRRDFPETRRGLTVRVNPLRAELSRDLRPALLVLLGAVALVLLIACGNLAGLMLVRGTGRAREIAIRSALGVGGRRLIRQLLTESALLACFGGLAGVGLSVLAVRSIGLLTKDPRLLDAPINTTVMVFAAAATLATTILFGVAPAIRTTRVDINDALKAGSRNSASKERAFAQRALVVAEVALCLVLLAGAGLLLKSFRRVLAIQPGFRSDNLVTMRIGLPREYNTVPVVAQFYRRLVDRLSALPGVLGATAVSRLPITGGEGNGDINIEGSPAAPGELGASTFRRVMPNYFQLMGIPLIQGREFDGRDDGSHGRIVIVNDSFARRFWPGQSPLGRRIKIGPADAGLWETIVGVVGDVRQVGLDSDPPFSTYEPLMVQPSTHFEIAVRTGSDPQSVLPPVRRELRALEPGLLIENVATMSQRIADSVAPRRLDLVLFGLFAVLALVLATVGLYGVVAYAAGQRTQEFGIRMALGARSIDVLFLVLTHGLRLALAGVAMGVAAALLLGRLLTGLLFGVEPGDPATLVAVSALLVAVAATACWLPAHRATRIAPVEALRGE